MAVHTSFMDSFRNLQFRNRTSDVTFAFELLPDCVQLNKMSVNKTHASTSLMFSTLIHSHLLAILQYCLVMLGRRCMSTEPPPNETRNNTNYKKYTFLIRLAIAIAKKYTTFSNGLKLKY